MTPNLPVGVYISRMLKAHGVDTIFGIPGVHNQELYRDLEGSGLDHILARHEQGAGFMADGYARASGKPGVCYLISGPGVTNAMTPMAQAYSDRVPMLIIASCLDETAALKGQLHQMKDQRLAAECVCDWSEQAETAQAAFALVERALAAFENGADRPVCIHIPISILESRVTPPVSMVSPAAVFAARTPDPQIVASIGNAIKNAQRPLFVFGGGVACDRGRRAATTLLERTGALAYQAFAGRGVLAPNHPQSLGSFLERPQSSEIFAQADLVLLMGAEIGEVELRRDHPGQHCPTICVDTRASEFIGSKEGATMAFEAPPVEVLCALAEMYEGPRAEGWTHFDVQAARARWRVEIAADHPGIVAACDALSTLVPEDTTIYSDMTQLAYGAKEVWEPALPGRWHHPVGFGTLGYALPAAIGGALAHPDRPTMAIAGDYGFQYTLPELATAVEHRLSLPIILWDNGKLGEIESSMRGAQIAPNAVVARNPDFLALGRAYGAHTFEPNSHASLGEALDFAFCADAPSLIRLQPDTL